MGLFTFIFLILIIGLIGECIKEFLAIGLVILLLIGSCNIFVALLLGIAFYAILYFIPWKEL